MGIEQHKSIEIRCPKWSNIAQIVDSICDKVTNLDTNLHVWAGTTSSFEIIIDGVRAVVDDISSLSSYL